MSHHDSISIHCPLGVKPQPYCTTTDAAKASMRPYLGENNVA